MALICFRLSRQLLAELDDLVSQGSYDSRADAIRKALERLLLIENLVQEGEINFGQVVSIQES
ncbi:MAG: ribbon-helix-helix domain-containing protein [Promethearchaeota archaeon]